MAAKTRRLVQVLPTSLSSLGGTERVASWIASVGVELQLESISFDNGLVPQRFTSSRTTMLNQIAHQMAVARAVRARLHPDDIVVSHLLFGAFLPRRRHAYVYQCTYAGQAEAMRRYLPPLDYRVARHLYGCLDRRGGMVARGVAVSASVQSEVRKFYGLNDILRIPNAVETRVPEGLTRTAARTRLGWSSEDYIALTIGRYEGVKGKRLLESLIPRLPDGVRLVIVAPNLAENRSDGNATVIPGVPRDGIEALIAAADVLLCPSRYESFGLTIAEAWAAGRPVISTDVGIARELRAEEPTLDAMVVRGADDAQGVIDRLNLLRMRPEMGSMQAEWGRQVVAERFSPDRFRRDYACLLKELGDC